MELCQWFGANPDRSTFADPNESLAVKGEFLDVLLRELRHNIGDEISKLTLAYRLPDDPAKDIDRI